MSSTMNSTTTTAAAATTSRSTTHASTALQALLAAALGLVLVWGVGFSHIDAVHNAAHDTRHSTGFPCH